MMASAFSWKESLVQFALTESDMWSEQPDEIGGKLRRKVLDSFVLWA